MRSIRFIFLILGSASLLIAIGNQLSPLPAMAMIAIIMAVWWIFEVLPLGVTALLPLTTYPIFGILPTKEVAPIYMSSVLFLFIGGFLVAIAMQRWNLHKRIALTIISLFGSEPKKLVLGFMVATAFLSMWISNTASTVMMVSIGLALIKSYESIKGKGESTDIFASALMMAIAYSATIGGMATLIGTPPNLALTRIYSISFPQVQDISFGSWIIFGFPTMLILLLTAWSVLVFIHMRGHQIQTLEADVISAEKKELGKVSYEEKCVFLVFISLAFLWIFRKDLHLGLFTIPGWSRLLSYPNFIDDGTVAVAMALILFMIPARNKSRILEGDSISKIPWQTILLFGGGFALAKGIQATGLAALIGQQFTHIQDIHLAFIILTITSGMSFLTELTSNMASTEMLLPILASVAKSANIPPLSIMIPATLAASAAFMLPAATAPNAIIFGSNKVKIIHMVKNGLIINLVSILVITCISLFVIPKIF